MTVAMLRSALTRSNLRSRLHVTLPVIAAPMFLVSGPELVIAACQSGVVGTFPSLNCRTTEQLNAWLSQIKHALVVDKSITTTTATPYYGVNLIVHPTNSSLSSHLDVVMKHQVPIVITSLGAARDVIDAVHSYNGIVFHDVTNLHHATKAINAGVDGIIAIGTGGGGHAGAISLFSLIPQLRAHFPDTILLAGGAISTGAGIRAALTLGADLSYMGTRFIATQESLAPPAHKQMIVESKVGPSPSYLPTIYTDKISGVYANFLRDSLIRVGINPDDLGNKSIVNEDFSKLNAKEGKVWKDIWSAGHGILNIHDATPTVSSLVQRITKEFQMAVSDETDRMGQWVDTSE